MSDCTQDNKKFKSAQSWYENAKEQEAKWIACLENQGDVVEEYEDKLDRIACESFDKGYKAALEKQREQSIYDVPSRNIILAVWELGNEWKELTNGRITEHGTQLEYIQKHWNESTYYLREKQGKTALNTIKEEKVDNTNKVEPKFKVGDWITDGISTFQIINIDDECYFADDGDKVWIKLSDNHYHLWTIQDAKDGDVLCGYCEAYDNPLIFILNKFEHVNFGLVRPSDYSSYCFLTASDKQKFKEGTYHHKYDIKPSTQEQRNLLFQKMKEAGYEWNAEKKKLKRIEQEQTELPKG